MLKVSITQCLTQDRITKQILDCLRELVETINQICFNTAKSYARSYGALLANHKALFCVCFMTNILSIVHTLTMVLQKERAPLVHIRI